LRCAGRRDSWQVRKKGKERGTSIGDVSQAEQLEILNMGRGRGRSVSCNAKRIRM